MQRPKISGVIHTKNEERHIANAVRSLQLFVDEVVVADMASVDRTVEIACSLGARVVSVPDVGYVEPARQQAVDATSGDWICLLDADEVIPSSLGRRLRSIADDDVADAVLIPRLNFIAGAPVRVAGWSPNDDRHLRFLRRGHAEFSSVIHTPIAATAESVVLHLPAQDSCCIYHFSYDDWSHWLRKMDRYTSVEAADFLAHEKRPMSGWLLIREVARQVAWRYLYRRGFKDTYAGSVLTVLMVAYRTLVYAKTKQASMYGDTAAIQARYSEIAETLLVDDEGQLHVE